VLEISGIDVFHDDLQALWDVSMSIDDGQIVSLVGSNGAGKSTLMQAVAGILRPKAGSIIFDGIRLDRLPAYRIVERGVCMVPEGRRLFPRMSILENLEVGATVKRARKASQETLDWVYEVFPVLRARSGQEAGTLSGGEQQMLALGRALMSRPKLLLIDEMSLGLSPIAAQSISEVIRHVNASRRLTILLVEQDVQLALSLAHRGYVMENGRIVGQGAATDLLCSEEIKEAYLGLRKVQE
jgi:branched-chain amino acid transport system ATP-binding protein